MAGTNVGSKSYVGLKDLVAAIMTKDDETGVEYGEIFKIAPAKTVGLAPSSSSTPEYGDNGVIAVVSSKGATTVSFGTSGIDDEVKAKLLGLQYDEGETTETKDFNPPYIALGYKADRSNGDESHVWMLKGKLNLSASEHSTKEDTANPQGDTMEGMFINRDYDGEVKKMIDTGKVTAEKTAKFFESVPGAVVTP